MATQPKSQKPVTESTHIFGELKGSLSANQSAKVTSAPPRMSQPRARFSWNPLSVLGACFGEFTGAFFAGVGLGARFVLAPFLLMLRFAIVGVYRL